MLVKYVRGLHLLFRCDPNTNCNEIFIILISFIMCLAYLSSHSCTGLELSCIRSVIRTLTVKGMRLCSKNFTISCLLGRCISDIFRGAPHYNTAVVAQVCSIALEYRINSATVVKDWTVLKCPVMLLRLTSSLLRTFASLLN